MLKRIIASLAFLGLVLTAGLAQQGDAGKTKDPESKHGLTLKLRKAQ